MTQSDAKLCPRCGEPFGESGKMDGVCIDCWPGYNLCADRDCDHYRCEHAPDGCLNGDCTCQAFQEGSTRRLITRKEFKEMKMNGNEKPDAELVAAREWLEKNWPKVGLEQAYYAKVENSLRDYVRSRIEQAGAEQSIKPCEHPAQICHPAYCRDEDLWRREQAQAVAEARLAEIELVILHRPIYDHQSGDLVACTECDWRFNKGLQTEDIDQWESHLRQLADLQAQGGSSMKRCEIHQTVLSGEGNCYWCTHSYKLEKGELYGKEKVKQKGK